MISKHNIQSNIVEVKIKMGIIQILKDASKRHDNVVQAARKDGIYCRTLFHVPQEYKPLFSEAVYNLATLAHYQRTDMFTSIALETTSICNRRCTFCPNSLDEKRAQRPQQGMEDELFLKIMRDLQGIGYRDVISFQHYGEPLLDPKLEQRLKLAREMLPHSYLQIKSNGDHLNGERFRYLREAGLDEVIVTNYNADNRLSAAIRDLSEYLLWNPEERGHFSIRSTPKYLYNRGGKVPLTDEEKIKLTSCVQESHSLNIAVTGDIVQCSNDYFGRTPFGNVGNQPLMEIWDSPRYVQHRHNIRKGLFNTELCSNCVK